MDRTLAAGIRACLSSTSPVCQFSSQAGLGASFCSEYEQRSSSSPPHCHDSGRDDGKKRVGKPERCNEDGEPSPSGTNEREVPAQRIVQRSILSLGC